MEYLRERQYYIDSYDLITIKKCIQTQKIFKENILKDEDKIKNLTPEEIDNRITHLSDIFIYFQKVELFREKEAFINERMEEDQKKENRYNEAMPPRGVRCKECRSQVKLINKGGFRTHNGKEQMLFFFDCENCGKRSAYYEDGTAWRKQPLPCPECDSPLEENSTKAGEVITTLYLCKKCGYQEKEVWDWEKDKQEFDEREKQERVLLAKYRDVFCLSDKEGYEKILEFNKMKQLNEMIEKEQDPNYQKTKQIQILKLGQIKELIERTITTEKYQDLQFSKPEISKYVIVDFTVNDTKYERQERSSCNKLKKLINNSLSNTNWRLMSEGISYRLGILSGRLKAYEREEELAMLVK